MKRTYKHIILGGTFDHFHAGHRLFIKTALDRGEKITIGITTEPLYRHKLLYRSIEPYKTREQEVKEFIRANRKDLNSIHIIPLTDVYGVSFEDRSPDAIAVTEATKKGAEAINRERKKIGMRPLDIIVVPWVRGEDKKIISSERIRYGDIDRNGRNYYEFASGSTSLMLPDKLRPALKEPLGDIFLGLPGEERTVVRSILETIEKSNPPMVFAIGDIITSSLHNAGYEPSLSVVDLRSRRQALTSELDFRLSGADLRHYRNEAGTISLSAIKQVKVLRDSYFKDGKPKQLVIQGEEDLIALPCILLAPLQSFVLYGQYDLGVVSVLVTERVKQKIQKLLKKFIPKNNLRG